MANSEMSAPAQKLPPAPVRITARAPSCRPRAAKISVNRRHRASDTALRLAGRLSVTVTTPSAAATTISSAGPDTNSPWPCCWMTILCTVYKMSRRKGNGSCLGRCQFLGIVEGDDDIETELQDRHGQPAHDGRGPAVGPGTGARRHQGHDQDRIVRRADGPRLPLR